MTAPRRRRSWWWVAVIAALTIGGVVVAVTANTGSPTAETHRFVIPAGTSNKLSSDRSTTVFPAELTVRLGDTLVIRNDDNETYNVGPFSVRAGETFRYRFKEQTIYSGVCALNPVGTTRIVVE